MFMLLILTNSCKKENNNNPTATVTDTDGNVYHTVKIGTQVWMVENLKTTKYRNGDPIPNIQDDAFYTQVNGAYCDYDNDPSNSAIYGRLYNWPAVNDNRNIAPIGWHVPTDTEWSTLTYFLADDYVESVAGGKLKEAGTSHWLNPNTGATNSTGFTALPNGSTDGFRFKYMGEWAEFWTSTAYAGRTAYVRYIRNVDSKVGRTYWSTSNGLSVRCIKD